MSDEKTRVSGDAPRESLPTINPQAERAQLKSQSGGVPSVVYIVAWIGLSSSVILFNKWILDTLNFRFPVILTTYHLMFASLLTQIMAHTTTMLDGRKSVKMTTDTYMRAIVPIGIFFSLSLICGNLTYLYLSVAFIQMLKATTPVAVLLAGWTLGVSKPNLKVFLNVSSIVVGVVLASMGEIRFVFIGFIYQIGGVIFEALRLTMVQRILSSPDLKMDPLVSLYYFAPVCAVMNFCVAIVWEVPRVTMEDFYNVGLFTFFLNGMCAFLLNIAVVMLIGKTSAVVLTLCGVLKDIMLVGASMMIWGTQVSPLQFFGYGIALGGMVYFKLGYDKIKAYTGQGVRQWGEFGARKPITRKLVVIISSVFGLMLLFGGLAPSYVPDYDPSTLASGVSNRFGMKNQVDGAS